jgi:hypothetical protein
MTFQAVKEDHKLRLERCKAFFEKGLISIEKSDPHEVNTELLQLWTSDVILYLFDLWSAIRLECSKQLLNISSQLPYQLSKQLFQQLLENLTLCVSPNPMKTWQEIHGTLLGIRALFLVIEHSELDLVGAKCLLLIGHLSIPVREGASDCLTQVCLQGTDKSKTIQQILLCITSSIYNRDAQSDEVIAVKLDGCLSCLARMISHSHDCLDAYAHSNWQTFISTMKSCIEHPASSVRQKAGQVITLMLAHPSDTQRSFRKLWDDIVQFFLVSKEEKSWYAQEVCLIIVEEAVRRMVAQYLAQLASGVSPDLQTNITVVFELIQALQKRLYDFLSHFRFEVRRVMVQLLPAMARGSLLFASLASGDRQHCSLLLQTQTEVSNSEGNHRAYCYDEYGLNFEFDQDVIDAHQQQQRKLLLSVQMVWASVLIKENRHLVEAFQASGVLPVIHGPAEDWSVEMQGRLQEVHLRQAFRFDLLHILQQHSATIAVHLLQALSRHDQGLLLLLESILITFQEISSTSVQRKEGQEEDDHVFVSTDFIEFFALAQCFLSSITTRSSWVGSHGYLVNQSWRELTIQVQYLQHRVDAAMTPLWLLYLASVRYSDTHHTVLSSAVHQPGLVEGLPFKRARSFQHPQQRSLKRSAVEYLILSELTGQSLLGTSLQSEKNGAMGNHNLHSAVKLFAEDRQHVGASSLLFCIQWNSGQVQDGEAGSSIFIPGVMLLPSLMDPSTHPLLHMSAARYVHHSYSRLRAFSAETHEPISSSSSSKPRALPRTPVGRGKLPISPPLSACSTPHSKKMTSSVVAALHSPQRLLLSSLHTPSSAEGDDNFQAYGLSTCHRNSYATMDRWHCEAISPLLPSLIKTVHRLEQAVWLFSLLLEWLLSSSLDVLWLDGRHFAKKALLEACVPLLLFIQFKLLLPSAYTSIVPEVRILALYWTRILTEVLATKMTSEQSLESRACTQIVKMLQIVEGIAGEAHPNHFLAWIQSHADQLATQDIFFSFNASEWLSDTIQRLVEVLEQVQQLIVANKSHLPTHSSADVSAAIVTLEASSTVLSAGDQEAVCGKGEDEFSDWDEEDDDSTVSSVSDIALHTNESAGLRRTMSMSNKKYSKSSQQLWELLQADVDHLHRQTQVWQQRMENFWE